LGKSATNRSWLREIGFSPSVQETLILRVLLVRNRVITGDGRATVEIVAGSSYGHGVELVRNYALWPITVYVNNRTSAVHLANFNPGNAEWGFTAELLPNHGTTEVRQLLTCHSSAAPTVEIRTEYLLSSGESDASTLELKTREPSVKLDLGSVPTSAP
jgi:hypothetical protein